MAKIPTNVQCCPLNSITGPADHANNSKGVLIGPTTAVSVSVFDLLLGSMS